MFGWRWMLSLPAFFGESGDEASKTHLIGKTKKNQKPSASTFCLELLVL